LHRLSRQFIARHQTKFLFMVFWLHISLLNTINVSSRGPLFLWHESSQITTILINLSVATVAILFYKVINKLFSLRNSNTNGSKD
jgi:hypothetical protein